MKKDIFKRIAAAAVTTVMIAVSLPLIVSAEDKSGRATFGNSPIINETTPVSLTITKYEAKDGDDTELDGNVTGTVQPATDHTPMKDVEFTVLKFANVVQKTDSEELRMYYKLSADGAAILNKAIDESVSSVPAGPEEDGKYAEGNEIKVIALQNFITNRTARGPVFTDIETGKYESAVTGTTGADGVVKFTSGAVSGNNPSEKHIDGQGCYLVVETKAPDSVTKRAHPFFVQLPMSDRTNLNGWIYDVYAYPKNFTGTIDIDKQVLAVEGNKAIDDGNIADGNHSAEANIGDTITYIVPFTMAIPDEGLSKLGIKDTMSKGLTFKPNTVKVSRTDGGSISENDYDVTSSTNGNGITTLNVLLKTTYLDEINKSDNKLPEFEVRYDVVLNKDAAVGSVGNGNTAKGVYRTTSQTESEPDKTTDEQTTTIYTWGINLTKVGSGDGNPALSDVEFKLSDNEGKEYKFVLLNSNEEGIYVPSTDSGATDTLKTNSEGIITIRGLKSDVYSLKEVKTKKGYVLLNAPVRIVITGDNSDGSAKATVNGVSAKLSETTENGKTSNTALVEVKIVNSKGFLLPSTGGSGTTIFTIAGITIISISAALLIILRRKTKSEK